MIDNGSGDKEIFDEAFTRQESGFHLNCLNCYISINNLISFLFNNFFFKFSDLDVAIKKN